MGHQADNDRDKVMHVSSQQLQPEAFFDEVYATHRQSLHAYFFGHTGDAEVAADLLQETFLRAWRNLHTLREMEPNQHRFWLFPVARNLLADHYRHQSVQTMAEEAWPEDPEQLSLSSVTPSPDAQFEQKERLQRVDEAIRRLPKNLRTVLAMQALGDLNSAEIGQALNMPAGTVRYQLSLARKCLAEELQLEAIRITPKISDFFEKSDI